MRRVIKPPDFNQPYYYYSQTPPGTNAINFAKSMNRQNIAQLKKNNLRAYLVHFGATLGPKVFITRSKQKYVISYSNYYIQNWINQVELYYKVSLKTSNYSSAGSHSESDELCT